MTPDTALLDFATGRVLRTTGNPDARFAPGSAVKPFTLLAALEAGLDPRESIACRRVVAAGSRRLPCAHSDAIRSFGAVDALAWSCNTYFASIARRLTAEQLHHAMLRHGLPARFALGIEELTLQAMGEAAVEASALDLARAFRRLMQSPHPVIRAGLIAAVERGTAMEAGSLLMGKTGTSAGSRSVQGWFAGVAPRENPRWAVAAHVLTGRGGADAAPIGRRMVEEWSHSAGGPR